VHELVAIVDRLDGAAVPGSRRTHERG
jgi:hypothetical protein